MSTPDSTSSLLHALFNTTTSIIYNNADAMNVLSKLPPLPFSAWTAVKVIVFLYTLLNIKNFPLTWHFRFYRAISIHWLSRRSIFPPPSHLFSPVTTYSRSPLYECDVNGHKSNSTYFSDIDIARTHLVCHLTKKAFALRRAKKQPVMYVALAGVMCLFRKEIKPLQAYLISSRVLCWDKKWVWVVSHFVAATKDKEGKRRVYASALTKYVFKSGRITVSPEVLFTESGLLPPRPESDGISGDPQVSGTASGVDTPSDTGLREINARAAVQLEEKVEDMLMRDVARMEEKGAKTEVDDYWTWERVEAERKRGEELANHMLGLDRLSEEYRTGEEEGLVNVGGYGMSI